MRAESAPSSTKEARKARAIRTLRRASPFLASERLTDGAASVASARAAHPMVIEAALLHAARTGRRVPIEATGGQANRVDGYAGMTPADFFDLVETLAARVGFDPARLIVRRDRLGAKPQKRLPAEHAMRRARAMIDVHARSGLTKLHLDTSMARVGLALRRSDNAPLALQPSKRGAGLRQ